MKYEDFTSLYSVEYTISFWLLKQTNPVSRKITYNKVNSTVENVDIRVNKSIGDEELGNVTVHVK